MVNRDAKTKRQQTAGPLRQLMSYALFFPDSASGRGIKELQSFAPISPGRHDQRFIHIRGDLYSTVGHERTKSSAKWDDSRVRQKHRAAWNVRSQNYKQLSFPLWR
jgi:hypothetical protein